MGSGIKVLDACFLYTSVTREVVVGLGGIVLGGGCVYGLSFELATVTFSFLKFVNAFISLTSLMPTG